MYPRSFGLLPPFVELVLFLPSEFDLPAKQLVEESQIRLDEN
jgi:hypothetical protein